MSDNLAAAAADNAQIEQAKVTAIDVGAAFDTFRQRFPAKPLPLRLVANQDQVKPMHEADGLLLWEAGAAAAATIEEAPDAPTVTPDQNDSKLLWAVEPARIPYAPERCDFGKSLESGVIKHSNLTGGGDAHCAGEMILIDAQSIVINGCSGRYGPTSEAEMASIARSFRASGYNVWSMGFDTEAAKPFPFMGVTPIWVPYG